MVIYLTEDAEVDSLSKILDESYSRKAALVLFRCFYDVIKVIRWNTLMTYKDVLFRDYTYMAISFHQKYGPVRNIKLYSTVGRI